MVSKRNEIHPISSISSIESHLKADIVIHKEDIRGVDDIYAFFLAFLAFFCLLTIDGTSYTIGLLTELIQSRFHITSLPLILLPGSLMIGMYHLTAPLADTINSGKGKLRIRAALGALLAGAASLSSAFITNYYAFLIVFGVLMGIGLGLLFIPCIANVSSWFVKYKPFGIGLAHSGTGFGIFIFSQFFPSMPKGFVFEGHFIAISVLCFLCAGAAFFFKKPEKYLLETLAEKKLKNKTELINKMKFEEKLRKENQIINFAITEKNRQKTLTNCVFDGMVLTIDNELINVTTSTSALYDQPRLTKEQVDQITDLVMKKIQNEKEMTNEIHPPEFKELVRDYIQSLIIINQDNITSLQDLAFPVDENLHVITNNQKELIICSIMTEFDKLFQFKNPLEVQDEEMTKESVFSTSDLSSNPNIANIDFEKDSNPDTIIKSHNFSSKLWKSPTFLLIIFSTMIGGLVLLIPYTFIPLFLATHNITEADRITVLSLMGFANIFGRILSEIYVEKLSGKISYDDCLWFHNGGLFIASLTIMFLPFAFYYYRIFVLCCCVHTTCVVFANSIKISLVLDYLGLDALTQSYCYMLIVQGLFMIAGPPLHALLFEVTNGNFHILFYTVGGLLALSALACSFIRLSNYLENCTIEYVEDVESGNGKTQQ